jgi:hypothetical protein
LLRTTQSGSLFAGAGAIKGIYMVWWGWLLLAWVVVAGLLALGMGATARTIEREERAEAARKHPRPKVAGLPGVQDAPPPAPRRSRLSPGLRAGPRR